MKRRLFPLLFFGFAYVSGNGQQVQKMTPEIKQQLNAYYSALETADKEKALLALSSLIQLDPDYANYRGARASVYMAKGNVPYDTIIQDLNACILLDPDNLQWRQQRVQYCLQIGTDKNKSIAVTDLKRIVKLDSNAIDARFTLYPFIAPAHPLTADSLRENIIRLSYSLASNKPDVAANWYYLAKVHLINADAIKEEDILLAFGYVNKAIAIDPMQWDYLKFRSHLFITYRNDFASAAKDLQQSVIIHPNGDDYAALVQALLTSNNKSAAREAWEKGIMLFPGSYALQSLRKKV